MAALGAPCVAGCGCPPEAGEPATITSTATRARLVSGARVAYAVPMCRNIRTLHNFEPPAGDDEVHAAALQYVRKISGTTKPSKANAEAFDRAVDAVTEATARLLDELVTAAPPKDREVEAAKRQARYKRRVAA